MEKGYLLGVDGGNTKTLYFLHDSDGRFVDYVAAGTCSHEALPDSYAGAERELGKRIGELFARNGIGADMIDFAVFGLAGADFAHQKEALSAIVARLGFRRFLVENDGYLGLKAGSPNGIGICNINGTGTVTVGIGETGERLQIGGLGGISSDKAGAEYMAGRGMAAVYDAIYRCGKDTVLKEMVFRAFDISDEADFSIRAGEALQSKDGVFRINKMMEEAERQGDGAVIGVLSEIGEELARNVVGCAKKLNMRGNVPVVLAGSVWAKGSFNTMFYTFKKHLDAYGDCAFSCEKLRQPPVAGAVIWALEEAKKKQSDRPIAFSRREFLESEAFAKAVY